MKAKEGRTPFRVYFWIIGALFLGGGPVAAGEVQIGLATGPSHFVQPILNRAFESFFARPPAPGELHQPEGGLIGAPGGDVTLTWIGTHEALLPGLRTRAGLSYGQRAVRLEEGFGIFTDPARLKVTALTFRAEAGIYRPLPLGQGVEAGASLGLLASYARGQVRSALLDIRVDSFDTTGFMALNMGWRDPNGRTRVDLTGYVYDSGLLDLSLSAGIAF